MLDEVSTVSKWIYQDGPIELRHGAHVPEPQEGRGIVLAVAVGLVLLIGGYVLIRWL